jgi:hypothetical protein
VGRWAGVVAAILLVGCGRAPETPSGTGAEQVVRDYYEALLRRDWPAAHALLLPESRRKCRPEEFADRCRRFSRKLGFEPKELRVRSCEEHGDEAVAQIVLTGSKGGKRRSARDGVRLRRGEAGWGIVLPPRFGRPQNSG